ncbi:MAG: ribosome small subunit-dependent GTPase A [Bacteroidota bacterium]|nr:ribosome small subunit-dependent GTPase A [Bacteroidota bacterium]
MKKGLVLKSTGSWYTVKTDDGEVLNCKIKGKLRTFDFKSTNPVAVGDRVEIEMADEQTGVITDISERKNYLIRKASNLSKQTHIIAANVDQALLVVTLAFPETPFEFIDRFLAGAEAYRIPVVIVINKTDLYEDTLAELIGEVHEIYEPIGYQVIETSAKNGKNLDTFKSLIDGKVSVLSGNSGVGKSSLINAVYPEIELKVGKISNYHLKGKHTTTFAEMIELPAGGYLIDTPGIKGFGMTNMDKEEIYHFFPEIFRYAASCQYNNCLHIEEPNCAVKAAVEKGEINAGRYYSYLSILNDEQSKYR